jgi:hypothetical protein
MEKSKITPPSIGVPVPVMFLISLSQGHTSVKSDDKLGFNLRPRGDVIGVDGESSDLLVTVSVQGQRETGDVFRRLPLRQSKVFTSSPSTSSIDSQFWGRRPGETTDPF